MCRSHHSTGFYRFQIKEWGKGTAIQLPCGCVSLYAADSITTQKLLRHICL